MSWDEDTGELISPTDLSPHAHAHAHAHSGNNKTPKKSPKNKTSSGSNSSAKSGLSGDVFPQQEPTLEVINDKLRVQSKQKINWSEGQIRDLVKPH